LDKLTTRAGGLFIWAETVVGFIEQGVHEKRLQRVLSGDMDGGDIIAELYRQILDFSFGKADDDMLKTFIQVVSTVILAKVPLHEYDLPRFILQPGTQIKSILNKLSSVISAGIDGRLRISHLTFSEYLCESDRCPEQFRVGREEKYAFAMACFRLMRDELKFNICDLETSWLLNDEVDCLQERIEEKVSGPLRYSCRFWASHFRDVLMNQCDYDALMTELEKFLYIRLLFWLEVMSLTNEVAATSVTLSTVARLITVGSLIYSNESSRR
jgi:hypothetical protein